MPKKKTVLLPCDDRREGYIRVYKSDYEKFKNSRKIVVTQEVIQRESVCLEYYSTSNQNAYGKCCFKNLDLIQERSWHLKKNSGYHAAYQNRE